MSGPTRAGFESTARAWVEHLREGGSTPWLSFVEQHAGHPPAPGGVLPGGVLPGAAQLELVRRLAARRAPEDPEGTGDFRLLADAVLDRSGPGRGLAELPLAWPATADGRAVGAPPIDPAELPLEELVRVGVGTLADLLLDVPDPRRPRRPRRRPWSRQFRLAGAPGTAALVRSCLEAAGHAEGGGNPEVVLFVPSFETLMAQVWSARVQRGAPVRWGTFLGSWASRADLPPSADVAGLAEQWASRVGTERVHLVVTTSTALARHTTARILGLRTHDPVLGRPAPLTGAGVDVMRRVNRLLNVRQPPALRDPLLRRLTALLPTDLTQSQPELTVPRARRDWASDRAERLTERLRDRGYAVHGDLDQIAVRAARAETRPPRHEVLDAVLVACLRAARPDR